MVKVIVIMNFLNIQMDFMLHYVRKEDSLVLIDIIQENKGTLFSYWSWISLVKFLAKNNIEYIGGK